MSWQDTNFDWNRARAFLVTVEKGSLSAAARALGSTQPTLGRQVAALEKELGMTLFERVGQSLELTTSGANLVKHVQAMSDAADQLALMASGESQDLSGLVTISASEIEAVTMLPKVIAKIHQTYPSIKLDIQVSSEVANLKRREADIALRSFRPTQPDLIARKLREDKIWLYGTAKYLTVFNHIKSLKELKTLHIIGFEQNTRLLDLLNSKGFDLNEDNMCMSSMSQLLQWQLVKQHLGVGFFPELIGDQEPDFIRAFESFGAPMTVPLWLVCHRELHTNLRVRKVFDLLGDMLSEDYPNVDIP
ncbi:MAG: LysR family transcriptional regulator [Saccharospirillaceae bacterium]|nr:LysR family transcriptional regulator [Pseudomonadales bacterium]NRB80767.1 LysR family transcriptional regulator [Saccharospirillaceae bacterium]